MFGLGKKEKLEKAMISELKKYAGVSDFPWEDAKVIGELLAAYSEGNRSKISLMLFGSKVNNLFEKYPDLSANWDDVFMKYKELGLFPKWDI